MSNDESVVDQIRKNAETVVTIAAKQLEATVAFDEAGVRWLDGYIQRQHEQGDPAIRDGLVNMPGCFLGECIIATYGGQWTQKDGAWGVYFNENTAAFPFAKVAKHLENGAEDSVLSFFTMIPVLMPDLIQHKGDSTGSARPVPPVAP